MTCLLGDTAAVKSKFLGLNLSLNSLTNKAKLALSDAGPRSHFTYMNSRGFSISHLKSVCFTCQHLGYSQSRSSPSNPCSSINCMTSSINSALFCGSLTNLEYLSPLESFQPPRAIRTLTPNFLKPTTLKRMCIINQVIFQYLTSYLFIEFIIQVSPCVVRLQFEGIFVQNSKNHS